MREKIKNILSNSYTKQGEFDEDKALNELCVLLDVSISFEDTANKLIEMYSERESIAVKNKSWNEAFQNEIRVDVLKHLILLHKHNEC